MLKLIEEGQNVKDICVGSERFNVLYASLIRKGLLSEGEEKVTLIGQDLLKFIESEGETTFVKRKFDSSDFDQWWEAFPGTNIFEHKGRKFTGARSLRISRDECRIKFNTILAEGKYTASELINSMKYDVLKKMDESVRTGDNKLSYLHNSLTYLNKKDFEPFIKFVKEGKHIIEKEETAFNGTEI